MTSESTGHETNGRPTGLSLTARGVRTAPRDKGASATRSLGVVALLASAVLAVHCGDGFEGPTPAIGDACTNNADCPGSAFCRAGFCAELPTGADDAGDTAGTDGSDDSTGGDGCRSNGECPAARPYCLFGSGSCVECRADVDCPDTVLFPRQCENSVCVEVGLDVGGIDGGTGTETDGGTDTGTGGDTTAADTSDSGDSGETDSSTGTDPTTDATETTDTGAATTTGDTGGDGSFSLTVASATAGTCIAYDPDLQTYSEVAFTVLTLPDTSEVISDVTCLVALANQGGNPAWWPGRSAGTVTIQLADQSSPAVTLPRDRKALTRDARAQVDSYILSGFGTTHRLTVTAVSAGATTGQATFSLARP
jgi:hypothetical protein